MTYSSYTEQMNSIEVVVVVVVMAIMVEIVVTEHWGQGLERSHHHHV